MQPSDFYLAVVIGKNYYARAFRIYGSMIGCRDHVLATITRPDREWLEWRGVQ